MGVYMRWYCSAVLGRNIVPDNHEGARLSELL